MKLKEVYKSILEDLTKTTWYHGTNADFNAFKKYMGTFNDSNRESPVFLSPDEHFAKAYGSNIYKVQVSPNLKIFDSDKIPTGYDLITYQKTGNSTGDFDYEIAEELENYLYDIEREDEYEWVRKGDYSTLEQPWFYDFLNKHKYDGSYIRETGSKNLFIFDPTNLKILNNV